MWVPFYNLAYVTVQHQIGDADRTHETFGLVLGSFTASLVAYPAFMFKSVATAINPTTCSPIVNASLFTLGFFRRTALLLDQCEKDRSASESRRRPPWSSLRGSLARTFGYRSTTELWDTLLRKGGPITVLRRGFAGVGAHTVGNFGPDVLCMGKQERATPRCEMSADWRPHSISCRVWSGCLHVSPSSRTCAFTSH